MLTLEALAEKFHLAGMGIEDIEVADLEVLGITKKPKSFKSRKYGTLSLDSGNWESFCAWVHEVAFGEPHPGSSFLGRGFRSQDYADRVAKRLREQAQQPVRFAVVVENTHVITKAKRAILEYAAKQCQTLEAIVAFLQQKHELAQRVNIGRSGSHVWVSLKTTGTRVALIKEESA